MKKLENIVVAMGTRPESIKLCPLILEMKKRENLRISVCHSGQHETLSDDALSFFGVEPDANLKMSEHAHGLVEMTAFGVRSFWEYLQEKRADAVVVHGDTTSAFCAALAAFYLNIPVLHVEAGLRSYDLRSPYPEEWNRLAIDELSSLCFAPTDKARKNLIRVGKSPKNIFVVGNTVTDALRYTVNDSYTSPYIKEGSRLVIFTAHRRESIGNKMAECCIALKKLASEYKNDLFLCPVHPNPAVRSILLPILSGEENIILTDPLSVYDFHNLLARAYMIMSDSGGIQEEASTLGVPTLVMRDKTERTEAKESGVVKVVGSDFCSVYKNGKTLLGNREAHDEMCACSYSYGDGRVSERICDIIEGKP
jgi:UDP-N-acetylglucosamine 2-epimerase (non-hydrolysing)